MYTLEPTTEIEIRQGMNSLTKPWSKLAFEHLGVKDAKRIGKKLTEEGAAEWEGFLLIHPALA